MIHSYKWWWFFGHPMLHTEVSKDINTHTPRIQQVKLTTGYLCATDNRYTNMDWMVEG
jgi:hypothetical protein